MNLYEWANINRWIFANYVFKIRTYKGSGTLMTSLYKENAQSWDTCISVDNGEECGLVSKPL